MSSTTRIPRKAAWPLRQRRGFTLVEVAVAATIMVLAISGSILVMQSGFRALDNARKTTLAAQIIQSEMELIRMLSWTRVQNLGTEPVKIDLETIFPKETALERQVLAQMKKVFTPIRTVTPLAEFDNDVVEISVHISWTGIDGIPHNRSSNTRYCKNGLYAYYYTVAK